MPACSVASGGTHPSLLLHRINPKWPQSHKAISFSICLFGGFQIAIFFCLVKRCSSFELLIKSVIFSEVILSHSLHLYLHSPRFTLPPQNYFLVFLRVHLPSLSSVLLKRWIDCEDFTHSAVFYSHLYVRHLHNCYEGTPIIVCQLHWRDETCSPLAKNIAEEFNNHVEQPKNIVLTLLCKPDVIRSFPAHWNGTICLKDTSPSYHSYWSAWAFSKISLLDWRPSDGLMFSYLTLYLTSFLNSLLSSCHHLLYVTCVSNCLGPRHKAELSLSFTPKKFPIIRYICVQICVLDFVEGMWGSDGVLIL